MDIAFAFHFMHGFDRNGIIAIDCCQFKPVPLFQTPEGESSGKAQPYLHRWAMDLNAANARVECQKIDGYESQFPLCGPRYLGQPYRHDWYTSPDGELASTLQENDSFYNMVGHHDHQTGEATRYSFGQAAASEALFVPRSEDAPEGDGYLPSVVTSFDTKASSLYIFAALKLADGPLAIAHLSHRVPGGFHGSWRPGR